LPDVGATSSRMSLLFFLVRDTRKKKQE